MAADELSEIDSVEDPEYVEVSPPPKTTVKVIEPSPDGSQSWLHSFERGRDNESPCSRAELLDTSRFVEEVERLLDLQEARIIDSIRRLLTSSKTGVRSNSIVNVHTTRFSEVQKHRKGFANTMALARHKKSVVAMSVRKSMVPSNTKRISTGSTDSRQDPEVFANGSRVSANGQELRYSLQSLPNSSHEPPPLLLEQHKQSLHEAPPSLPVLAEHSPQPMSRLSQDSVQFLQPRLSANQAEHSPQKNHMLSDKTPNYAPPVLPIQDRRLQPLQISGVGPSANSEVQADKLLSDVLPGRPSEASPSLMSSNSRSTFSTPGGSRMGTQLIPGGVLSHQPSQLSSSQVSESGQSRVYNSMSGVRAQMNKVKEARMTVKVLDRGKGLAQEVEELKQKNQKFGYKKTWTAMTQYSLKRLSNEVKFLDIATAIDSRPAELVISFVILLNAVVIGVQVDAGMRPHGKTPAADAVFRFFDLFFMIFFTLELSLRLFAEKYFYFSWKNAKFNWNIFDAILVFTSLLEELLNAVMDAKATANMSTLRVFRMLRLVRVFRVIRVMRFFRDLRVIASGIASSLQSLVWAGLLLFVLMFLCAVCVLQFAVEEVERRDKDPSGGVLDENDYSSLRRYYESLFSTMYTLYLSITGGLNWREAAEPLMSMSIGLGLLYCCYIAFAVLCVLNIITGVFVENANKMTAQDHEMVMMEELETRRKFLEEVKVLFEAADTDGSGWLSAEEFSEQLKDIQMQAWFRKIGIQIESYSAGGLFQMLDFDGDGQLDLDEFAIALQQVHGAAKSIDVAKICHDTRILRKNLETLSELCFFAFEHLSPGCVEACFEEEGDEEEEGDLSCYDVDRPTLLSE